MAWTPDTARALSAPQEVQIVTRRPDGTLRRPRIIWIVRAGDRVFVRSTKGRGADWFRGAVATGAGQIVAGGVTHDVIFAEAGAPDLPQVGAAYRAKYGHYASIVDHLEEPGPRAATLEVLPA
ncbi:DUF2255 family protein [Kineosporia sp. J2-2]|uniref:DUF2255 family protein n=1 Tax=Kineosporia corallincola TaxID=2835133 RepID=A0ABS5TT43_9ACTN|nr:DUF2255 family protein [Kineosporia corallincola]MBT0773977.1 DUF2255 family protein [Kineosporia corallincola]